MMDQADLSVAIVGEPPLDTVTSLTLLEGLRNPEDQVAWRRFADRYQPMMLSFARRLRLDDNDALDAAQETMLAFVTAYRREAYDRGKGRLRSWLFGIAHRKIVEIHRRRRKERVLADRSDVTGFLETIESPDAAEPLWEQEWQRAVLQACLAEVGKHVDHDTLESFRLYVLEEWPAEKVAAHLGLSRNAVYINKNRVLNRLRELQRWMEEIW
jgi:RNA polymerase sigma-70 factor, ECF subfamily